MQYDVVAVGECLVDCVVRSGAGAAKLEIEGNAGGAPANVLAMAAKLGRKAAFISKVGSDAFGSYLMDSVASAGVDTHAMVKSSAPTTVAMVALDESGNRSFAFYRNGTADVLLEPKEVDMQLVCSSKIFHFGSVSLTDEPARTATLMAASRAREAGVKISFDPNYRPLLWKDEKAALVAMHEGMAMADFVKVSDEEAEMLSGEQDPQEAGKALMARYNMDFLAVTLGPKGCIGFTKNECVAMASYDVKTVDTTGAGDAFWGAVLHRLLQSELSKMSKQQLEELLMYGNAAGSCATIGYGAIAPQPSDEEIRSCMAKAEFLC